MSIPTSSTELAHPRDFREVGYCLGDVREVAKRIGAAVQLKRNDLGEYFALEVLLGGIPVQLVGLVPFAAEGFTIVADTKEAIRAIEVVQALIVDIGYPANRVQSMDT